MRYKVVYTKDLPEGVGGRCEYPIMPWGQCTVKVLPKYTGDEGLIAHELEHVKQWTKWNVLHSLLYAVNKKYRYRCELDAYTRQIEEYAYTNVNQAHWIIDALMNKYNLDMCRSDIINDVRGRLCN